MRFQPSAYAAPPLSPFGAVEGGGGASADTTGMAVDVAGKLVNVGLDVWQQSADAKADKWRKIAAKKAAKKKKAAEQKAAAAQQTAIMPAPSPVQAAATMNPMLKWGLVAAGVGLVGFAIYMLTRKQEEPPKPKHNPKRVHVKAPPRRRNPEVQPARTEVPAVVEEVEVEEDVFSGPEDGEAYDDGTGFSDEGGE